MKKEMVYEAMVQAYEAGEYSEFKSGRMVLCEKLAGDIARAIAENADEGSFEYWAIGSADALYMGERIKAAKIIMEKWGYKVKVSVVGNDTGAKKVRGRYYGGAKKRLIVYKKVV